MECLNMNGNLDKKNGFLYAKAAVAALCGAFTAARQDYPFKIKPNAIPKRRQVFHRRPVQG